MKEDLTGHQVGEGCRKAHDHYFTALFGGPHTPISAPTNPYLAQPPQPPRSDNLGDFRSGLLWQAGRIQIPSPILQNTFIRNAYCDLAFPSPAATSSLDSISGLLPALFKTNSLRQIASIRFSGGNTHHYSSSNFDV